MGPTGGVTADSAVLQYVSGALGYGQGKAKYADMAAQANDAMKLILAELMVGTDGKPLDGLTVKTSPELPRPSGDRVALVKTKITLAVPVRPGSVTVSTWWEWLDFTTRDTGDGWCVEPVTRLPSEN